MTSATDESYWILDFCECCDRLVWMDLLEQVCPECRAA